MERHSLNLAKGLASSNVSLDVFYPNKNSTSELDLSESFTKSERQYISNQCLPWTETSRLPGHYIRSLKDYSDLTLKRYLERPPSDFIIAKSLTGWSFVRAKQAGATLPPVGVNLHGYEPFQRSSNLKEAAFNALLRPTFQHLLKRADYVYSYGGKITDVLEQTIGVRPERIIEVPGGVDHSWIADEAKPTSSPLQIAFLGRYERRKGIEELNKAIEAHPQWRNNADFHFIGPIQKKQRISQTNVTYHGPICDLNQLQNLLPNMDVLICPSHSEGMPNVIMEAMASGLAVIATDVGATSLLVSDHNGLLMPKATIHSISEAVWKMLEKTSDEILEMKRRSLEKIRSFTWNRIAKQNLEAISSRISIQ